MNLLWTNLNKKCKNVYVIYLQGKTINEMTQKKTKKSINYYKINSLYTS